MIRPTQVETVMQCPQKYLNSQIIENVWNEIKPRVERPALEVPRSDSEAFESKNDEASLWILKGLLKNSAEADGAYLANEQPSRSHFPEIRDEAFD